MSGETILVRLRAIGERRFRRDLKTSTRAVTRLTKAHVRASKAARRHQRVNARLSSGLKVLGMLAGRAGGAQGVGLLAQALRSTSDAAAGLTSAIDGLTTALSGMVSAAVKHFQALSDAAASVSYRLREQAALLRDAFAAATVSGATTALAGLVSVLQSVRVLVLGLSPAFAAAGSSASASMAPLGDVLRGPGAGAGLSQPTSTAAAPSPGGKGNAFSLLGPSTSKLGEVPSAAMPFAGLMTATVDEINKAALPGLIEGMESLNGAFQAIVDSGALEILGAVLGDTFSWVSGVIKEVVTYLQMTGDLQPAILGIATALGLFKLAMLGVNLVMAANPVTLVAAAFAVLIGAAVYAYQRFEWFRNIVNGAWNILKSIGAWVVENWQPILIALTGPLGAAIVLIVNNFDRIKGAVSSVFDRVKAVFSGIVEIVTGLPGTIASIGKGLWNGLRGGLVDVLNWAIDKINWLIRKANKVPFVNISEIGYIDGGGSGTGPGPDPAAQIPGAPDLATVGSPGTNALTGNVLPGKAVKKARGGSIPGGPPFNDRVPSLLTPGEHVWTRGEVKAAGGHRAVKDLRRNAGGGSKVSAESPRYVSVDAPVQVRIGEGVLADAMANIHLKVQAGIPT